jgi:DNA polymerase III subunit gamma/tau
MDHQVLARKWRPRLFKEMVGQEHVLKALINALDQNRLHHAYLFTGTRGVGKTTIARILAKCLNCEQGVTSEPCGTCASCVEINEGRCVDLIEVDAASRTKVEDTRELLDNVQYLPTRARFKVYLIDEVHMLSNNSFNALLKTLEEPPPHVKFLLATTDPQKLPVTILSRCLQFNLKNMSPERIAEHLKFVLGQEQVAHDEAALWQLGRAADGSMRDALSLTDQAIAFGENSVLENDVSTMLGSIDRGRIQQIFQALLDKDAAAILDQITELAQFAPDYAAVLEELIALLHRIAVTQAVPEAVNGDAVLAEKLRHYASEISPEDVQLYYQIALIGRRDLPLNPDAKAGLEMVLLRMLAFSPVDNREPEPAKKKLTNKAPQSAAKITPSSVSAPPTGAAQAVGSQLNAHPAIGSGKAAQALAAARGDASPVSRTKLDLVIDNERVGVVESPVEPSNNPAIKAPQTKRPAPPRVDAAQPPKTTPAENPVAGVTEPAVDEYGEYLQQPSESDEKVTTVLPVTAEDRVSERFPLSQLNNNDDWITVAHRSGIRGMTRNIVLQCTFELRDQSKISLRIDPQYIDLLNDSHQSRIEQGLSEMLDGAVTVAIQAGSSTHESPAAWQQRIQAERLKAARQALDSDPNVQNWVAEFDATLEVDSIKPLK